MLWSRACQIRFVSYLIWSEHTRHKNNKSNFGPIFIVIVFLFLTPILCYTLNTVVSFYFHGVDTTKQNNCYNTN